MTDYTNHESLLFITHHEIEKDDLGPNTHLSSTLVSSKPLLDHQSKHTVISNGRKSGKIHVRRFFGDWEEE